MSESERVEKNHSLPGASSLEYYRIVRSQIEHEDNVMNQRLNWFVAAQSFLFTANAIVLNAPPSSLFPEFREQTVRLLALLVPIVAICCGLVIYTGLIGGVLALRNLRESLSGQTYLQGTSHLPPLHGSFLTRILGLAAPVVLPLMFLIVWTLVLLPAVRLHSQ